MIEIKAPRTIPIGTSVFLAGSIEMGTAEKWQDRVVRELTGTNWVILNPRRDDWDSSWVQSTENEQFVEQVTWELKAMEQATYILMYFDPATKSPITLLELGLWARSRKLMVVCPEGFWRKGNVDIVCNRYHANVFDTIEDAIAYLIIRG